MSSRFDDENSTFTVDYHERHVLRSCVTNPAGDSVLYGSPDRLTLENRGTFTIHSSFLLCDDLAKQHLPNVISRYLNASEQHYEKVIDILCSTARSISTKSILLYVTVIGFEVIPYTVFLEMTEAEAEKPKLIPASKSAIDALERVVFDNGLASIPQCMICMEEFQDGFEVSSMPCNENHIFHGDCIAQWLQISHFCPLCRFSLAQVHEN